MTGLIQTRIKNRYGLDIAVMVEIPKNPKGLAFIVHGFMSFKEAPHIQKLSELYLQQQIIVVRFDATHSFGQSEGNNSGTITTYTHDLEDVIDWAQQQDWFIEPYILTGHSLGGIAILEAAKTRIEKIKGLAPLATVFSGTLDHEAYKAMDREGYEAWQATGFKSWLNRKAPEISREIPFSHMENRLLYNVLEYAADITVPVFMIVGTEDLYCPPANQQMLYDALGTKDKEIHVIEGAPHSFKSEYDLSRLEKHFAPWLARIV